MPTQPDLTRSYPTHRAGSQRSAQQQGRSALGLLVSLCASLAAVAVLISAPAHAQVQFADPSFQATWARSDGPVASGAAKRPWVWGPVPGRSLSEPFAGLPGGTHLVQYFDKGRMEINNPGGNRNDPFYVTNGRLAVELISGQMQIGPAAFENRGPAAINLASDADDPSAPTYQSFNGVSNIPGAPNERRKTSQVGQVVRTALDRQGVSQPWPANHADYGVRIVHFEPATGHNIPDVFWNYLNQQTTIIQATQVVTGPLFFPWFSVSGYPISEPYWSYVKVGGRYTDVLMQAFERRVLTFVPHLPSPFKVQMGNIGVHYYEWRYLQPAQPTPRPGPSTPTSQALPPLANITIDDIAYRRSITDLNGNFATLTNRGETAQLFNGWWLDSPRWTNVERFYFPPGVTLEPGASIRVHAGPGNNSATDLYMFRTTVMWEGKPYDLAVLYDNFGREVTRFFPAAETGVPPTVPPATTPARTTVPGGTPARPSPTRVGGTAPTPTTGLPNPVKTEEVGVPTPSFTPSRTPIPGTPTATRSTTATVRVTITITATTTITATRTVTNTPTP